MENVDYNFEAIFLVNSGQKGLSFVMIDPSEPSFFPIKKNREISQIISFLCILQFRWMFINGKSRHLVGIQYPESLSFSPNTNIPVL